ncbi:hypothetical protein [Lentilactobacillus kosonis]|uniref:Uncharacterized protein n=1 Tax=Lentilactobacillus kosonis TaxID=2810561 RepID=A0A401FPJ5_9LACO|nr:hypothetical protein [Lentilactobacillus kosonis]GAY74315.1 hypothetical protein NBRC111893_2461 [Lentilactobacillus kosonis]
MINIQITQAEMYQALDKAYQITKKNDGQFFNHLLTIYVNKFDSTEMHDWVMNKILDDFISTLGDLASQEVNK